MSLQFRTFVAFVLLAGISVLLLTRTTLRDIRPQPLQATEDTLVETANLLAAALERGAAATSGEVPSAAFEETIERALARPLDARIYDHTKRRMTLRVYVTDARGVVVYDSAREAEGRDYSRWRDVRLTLRGAYGARATRSDPDDPLSSIHYVAAPVRSGGRLVGVVSVGKPVDSIKQFIQRTNRKVAGAGAAVVLAAAVLSLALATWITVPLRRLEDYAGAIAKGGRPAPPRLRAPEVKALASALESMRDALEGKRYVEGYVRSLTHEIKSPLAAIRASAELLDEEMPTADRRRFLANVRLEAERLQRLVDRMLELSALEARKSLEHTEPVALGELIEDVRQGLEPLARRKGVKLTVEADDSRMSGDRLLLRQALANLVQNALSATPRDGSVSLHGRRDGDVVRMVVEDSGPGVPEYALPRVFERFYSLPVAEGGTPGTGLGLPFVREVALLHGGGATLVNAPGGGARAELWVAAGPAVR